LAPPQASFSAPGVNQPSDTPPASLATPLHQDIAASRFKSASIASRCR
jgi:hypothetical protein